MFLYFDQIDMPKREEIVLYKTSHSPLFHDGDDWIDWVKTQGEVLMQVICDDGIVMIVRLPHAKAG